MIQQALRGGALYTISMRIWPDGLQRSSDDACVATRQQQQPVHRDALLQVDIDCYSLAERCANGADLLCPASAQPACLMRCDTANQRSTS